MKLRSFSVLIAALVISLVPAAHARGVKADVYAGYSRVGANLYGPYTPGMNGWQLTMHVKAIRFVGVEGDVSHYSQNVPGLSQQVTLLMFGPRVTFGALGFKVFAHGLGGIAHENATIPSLPSIGYDAVSYAIG